MPLVIRSEQKAALGKRRLELFKHALAEHLQGLFPTACEQLDESALRSQIDYGIEKAALHGIDTERQAAKYLELMFILGRDFDTDPTYPWAAEILSPHAPMSPAGRMRLLFREARCHMEGGVAHEQR